MLSIENPPPDPSSPCQVLVQLKSGGDEIERPPHKLPLPEVDLLKKPSLDNQQQHTPLPQFSIRDYVFTARDKDIKKNWPFSPKNLQLCLKHGLKDPLPPFEPLGTVRNQSIERCAVETSSLEKKTTTKFGDEPSGSNDHVVLESFNDACSNHNLAGTCIDNRLCRSRGEHGNDLPSTTASVSQSDIDSVLVNKQSYGSLETDTTVEASAEVQAAGKIRKTDSATQTSGKKCILVVKFGVHSERSSTEDIAPSSTMLSESMASKVCPVCKTFSSSSNTTLNAHIDQCLSDEPTPKWTVDSKLSRHRIKPRKTRMMVDVYATAKPCTLEELDRRNGTCWATASNILSQDSGILEISDEGKKQRASNINPKDTGDVGAVYFDANGTKIRILSKSSDVPLASNVGDDPGPSKAFKGNKGSKFLSTKKKKQHSSKHHKYLKLAPQSRKLFSHKTRSCTMVGAQEGYHGVAESCKSGGSDVPKQNNSGDSRNFGESVCSKQAGFSRKPDNQDRNQFSVCRRNVSLGLQVQKDQPHIGEHVVERNCVRKLKRSSENPISSPEKCEKTEKPVFEALDMNEREHSFGRKRVRSSLCGARIRKENQSSKDRCHLDKDHLMKSLKSGGNCLSSSSKKVVDIDANSNPKTPVTAMAPISGRSCAFKCFRSSPKRNVSSASSRSSTVKSVSNLVKNHLVTESPLHFMEEIDEDVSWGSESDQEYDLVHNGSENHHGRKEVTEGMSLGGKSIQGALSGEQRRRKSISRREESMALKSIQSTPSCSDDDETENTDSSASSSENILDKADGLESFEENVTSLSHSVETKFNKPSNLSKNRSNSLQAHEDYSGPLCGGAGLADLTEPSLGEPRMFCAEVSHDIIGQTCNMGGELDSDAAQLNSFPEVDPIPIPGPPGSFLPSPRDMGSDDFQGNSSLTTSRIQSSQDQLDLVDGDSSDSPISAVSTISNFLEAKSGSKFTEPLAFVSNPAMLENYRSGCSTYKSETLVENSAAFRHTSTGLDRTFEAEKLRVHRTPLEKRPLILKNDNQPCCCQRKDRSSHGFALNYQDSQLLRRRTTASMMFPTMGMQIAANQNISPDNMDARPETNSLSSIASLGSERMVLPIMKPPADSIAFKGFPGAGVKLSDRSNCDPATPSSNPVLRLMGKNLMVVNKDEDTSVPLGQAQPCAQSNHLTPKFPTSSGISPRNIENQGGIPFHQTVPQSSLIFDQHAKGLAGQYFDVQLTNGYRNCANLGTPAQFPAGMFFDERMKCGLTTSMELYKYAGDYNLPAQPSRPKNKPGPDMEKVTTLDFRHRNGDSAVSGKEVIVIDDAPESETNKFVDTAKHFEGLRESTLIAAADLSLPLVPNYSARQKNPFSCYLPEDSLRGDQTVVQNNNFNAIPSGRANTVPFRWDYSSEGSGVPQRAPLMAASPSRGNLRPAVYYSPSLS